VVLSQSNYAINGDEEACEVLIALVGVPVIGLCYSALGETRSVKERPRTRPNRLCAGGSAASSLWNDGTTAIRGVHERTRLEITTVSDSPNYSRIMRRGGLLATSRGWQSYYAERASSDFRYLGAKRTSQIESAMSANDPKRTSPSSSMPA
jgi:hypothetical protein